MDQINTPREIILSFINGTAAATGPVQATDIAELSPLASGSRAAAATELAKLGFLKRSGGRYSIITWTPLRILDHLAVAGAILSLAAYQIALRPNPAKVAPLRVVNDAIKALKVKNSASLLEGAWLDYLFHRETVRQSGNAAAWSIYEPSIPAAVWLAGANYYHSEDPGRRSPHMTASSNIWKMAMHYVHATPWPFIWKTQLPGSDAPLPLISGAMRAKGDSGLAFRQESGSYLCGTRNCHAALSTVMPWSGNAQQRISR